MSKVVTEKTLRITLDFLEGLTSKQFQDLVDGNAFLRYEVKSDGFVVYEQLMEKIKQDAAIEKYIKSYTKKELTSFCSYFKIEIKTRDTKKVILEKIATHINSENTPRENSEEDTESVKWKQIENALHTCDTLDMAKELLNNHELLRLKRDIVAFAKALGVYVNQKYTKQELLERIADSVVGARIRGMIIRLEE